MCFLLFIIAFIATILMVAPGFQSQFCAEESSLNGPTNGTAEMVAGRFARAMKLDQ